MSDVSHSDPRWAPGTSINTLRQVAEALGCIRRHFESSGSLEVMTPALVSSTVTDPGILSVQVTRRAAGVSAGGQIDRGLYLHTSPEFAMKRLLCGGSGDIHQICKVFRSGESGNRHNPEFTMVEWYRVGRTLDQLVNETVLLITAVYDLLGKPAPDLTKVCWYELVCLTTGLSPTQVWDAAEAIPVISRVLTDHGVAPPDLGLDLAAWIDLLMASVIYPSFANNTLTAIVEYPTQLSALAKTTVSGTGHPVAERFELFWGNLELANGYHELTDATELEHRFNADLTQRRIAGLPEVAIDRHLLAAQRSGLPDCAGVALGFDRLMMAVTGASSIDAVIPFSVARA